MTLPLAAAPTAAAQQPPGPLGRLRAVLNPQEVLPTPGPSDVEARLAVDLHTDQACWEISWVGVAPTAAHLYRGSGGEVGPVVIGLFEVQAPLADQDFREGCTGADRELLRDLSQRPEGYYAQLRSREYPDGAARGQLAQEGRPPGEALPHTGPDLPLPTPLTQALLVVLVGGALLLGPLADRHQQRTRDDGAGRTPPHLPSMQRDGRHALGGGHHASIHTTGGHAMKGLLATGLAGLAPLLAVWVPLVTVSDAATPLPSGVGDQAGTTWAQSGLGGAGDRLADADHPVEGNRSAHVLTQERAQAAVPPLPTSTVESDAAALLEHPRLHLSALARQDLERTLTQPGWIDGRVLALLGALAHEHRLTVAVLRSGHATYVKGTTRISHHVVGRAVDITQVDGQPVTATNQAARGLVAGLLEADGALRPDEIGSPFAEFDALPGAFSDPDHRTHVHIGYGEAT